MSIFIGEGFVIISTDRGDVIFNDNGISVNLHKHVKDVLVEPTPGCAELALMIIGE